MHHSPCELVNADPLLSSESEGLNRALKRNRNRSYNSQCTSGGKKDLTYICGHQLLAVINAGHADLTLADKVVVVGVVGDKKSLWREIQAVQRERRLQFRHY